MRILLADDQPDMLQSLGTYLQLRGHNPVLAEDGEKALLILKTRTIEAAVIDMVLPKISGPKVIELAAKELPAMPPVVVVTGFDADYAKGLPHVVAVLTKPIDPEKLESLLLEAVHGTKGV